MDWMSILPEIKAVLAVVIVGRILLLVSERRTQARAGSDRCTNATA